MVAAQQAYVCGRIRSVLSIILVFAWPTHSQKWPPRKGGSVSVSGGLRAGDGAQGHGGDANVTAGDGFNGASGGDVTIGPGEYRAGDAGADGAGGNLNIKAGDGDRSLDEIQQAGGVLEETVRR